MPSFVKRRKATENPAGGINPALEPNVGQYGWTSYDAANVNQLIQYVDQCKKYAEIAKGAAEYIESTFEGLKDLITYLEEIYDKIKPIADEIDSIYTDVSRWHKEVMVARIETQLYRNEASAFSNNADLSAKDAAASAEAALHSENNAKIYETNSFTYLNESREIAEDLRKGQVYRGTWNPSTGAFPNHGGTNSVWDVVLDAGTDSLVFGGFTWHNGDRLLYILADLKWDQLKTGSGVLSVNGKTGSVTLSASEVGAIPVSGGTLTGDLIAPNYIFSGDDAVLFDNRGGPIVQTTKTFNANLFGNGANETYIVYKDNLRARDKNNNDYTIFHSGRPPSPQEVGAVSDSATVNGKLVKDNPTITLAELGGFPNTGAGGLNGPLTCNGVVRVNAETGNPIFELHSWGVTGAMSWIDRATGNWNFSSSNGGGAEAKRFMSFTTQGVGKIYNTLEATTAVSARSVNGQKFIDLEAHDNGNPYISFDPADGGGGRVGITFDGKEAAFGQRVAAGDVRVGNDGGLKFSPFSDLGGVSWGMGIEAASGYLNLHQYANGVWQQAPLQFDPTARTTFINNILNVTAGHILSQRTSSPIGVEMLVPGQHASMLWMDNSANMNFAGSNGSGAEITRRMTLTAAGAGSFANQIISGYPNNRGWGGVGQSAFYQGEVRVGDGSLTGLITGWRHYPGVYNLEMGMGQIFSSDVNASGNVLWSNDGGSYNRVWVFRNSGAMDAPQGVWFMDASGLQWAVGYGSQYLHTWCSSNFAPISDARWKDVLGDSTESANAIVDRLQFKRFEWIEGERKGETVEIGLIAQEVEAIDPHYTKDVQTFDGEGNVDTEIKTLDTAALLSLALKAIQEQNVRIQELEDRITTLEGKP